MKELLHADVLVWIEDTTYLFSLISLIVEVAQNLHIVIVSKLVRCEAIFILPGPVLLLQLLVLHLLMLLLYLFDHFIVAVMEDVLAPLKFRFILCEKPIDFIYRLAIHLQQLLRLVLYVELADRADAQWVHIRVVVLLQASNDVLFASAKLTICFVKHLIEKHFVAESFHLFLLLGLERASLFHDDGGNQVCLYLIHTLLHSLVGLPSHLRSA